jgi:hypothetical protein
MRSSKLMKTRRTHKSLRKSKRVGGTRAAYAPTMIRKTQRNRPAREITNANMYLSPSVSYSTATAVPALSQRKYTRNNINRYAHNQNVVRTSNRAVPESQVASRSASPSTSSYTSTPFNFSNEMRRSKTYMESPV